MYIFNFREFLFFSIESSETHFNQVVNKSEAKLKILIEKLSRNNENFVKRKVKKIFLHTCHNIAHLLETKTRKKASKPIACIINQTDIIKPETILQLTTARWVFDIKSYCIYSILFRNKEAFNFRKHYTLLETICYK